MPLAAVRGRADAARPTPKATQNAKAPAVSTAASSQSSVATTLALPPVARSMQAGGLGVDAPGAPNQLIAPVGDTIRQSGRLVTLDANPEVPDEEDEAGCSQS